MAITPAATLFRQLVKRQFVFSGEFQDLLRNPTASCRYSTYGSETAVIRKIDTCNPERRSQTMKTDVFFWRPVQELCCEYSVGLHLHYSESMVGTPERRYVDPQTRFRYLRNILRGFIKRRSPTGFHNETREDKLQKPTRRAGKLTFFELSQRLYRDTGSSDLEEGEGDRWRHMRKRGIGTDEGRGKYVDGEGEDHRVKDAWSDPPCEGYRHSQKKKQGPEFSLDSACVLHVSYELSRTDGIQWPGRVPLVWGSNTICSITVVYEFTIQLKAVSSGFWELILNPLPRVPPRWMRQSLKLTIVNVQSLKPDLASVLPRITWPNQFAKSLPQVDFLNLTWAPCGPCDSVFINSSQPYWQGPRQSYNILETGWEIGGFWMVVIFCRGQNLFSFWHFFHQLIIFSRKWG